MRIPDLIEETLRMSLGSFAGEVGESKITRSQDQLDDDTTFVEGPVALIYQTNALGPALWRRRAR